LELERRSAALSYLDITPGVGRFFERIVFVTFAVFCANGFFFVHPALRQKKAKIIFEQKIAKITKRHCL
jgi:hypothetical protein